MMKIYIDLKKVKIIRRSIKSAALRALNTFRYNYPGPTRAASIADLTGKGDTKLLWAGHQPQEQNFEHCQPREFLGLKKITFKEPFVAQLKKGRVFGERGYVITSEGFVLTDVNPEMSQHRNRHSLVARGRMNAPQHIPGNLAVLNSAGYNNYYHYLFDTLGRLQYLEKINIHIDHYYTPYNTKFQKDLLQLLEIPRAKIIPAAKNAHLLADNLIVTSLPGDNSLARKRYKPYKDFFTYQYVRTTVLNKLQQNIPIRSPLIYIQRKGNRTIQNENELLKKLRSLGHWEIVTLENLSIVEQANLFRQARVIVALHGAGLANLIYCDPGAAVVEIINPVYPSPLYYQIATLFQLTYYPIMGKSKKRIINKKNDIKGDVIVDVSEMMTVVKNAVESYVKDGISD